MMCKRAYRRAEVSPAAAGAYEGQTIRIDGSEAQYGEHHHSHWARGFPWWMLWLIWPLIGVLKWVASQSGSALAAVRDNVGAFERPTAALVAIALIIAGLVLVRRQ